MGKTFITALFAKTFVEKKLGKAAFLHTPSCFRSLTDLCFHQKERFAVDFSRLLQADLLIFDDFGTEYKSEFIRDSILFPLLNEALQKKKTVCFTSVYTLRDIETMYALKEPNSPKARELKALISSLGNFQKIRYVEDELVIVEFRDFLLDIHGNALLIIQLTDDELYLQGNITEMDIHHA